MRTPTPGLLRRTGTVPFGGPEERRLDLGRLFLFYGLFLSELHLLFWRDESSGRIRCATVLVRIVGATHPLAVALSAPSFAFKQSVNRSATDKLPEKARFSVAASRRLWRWTRRHWPAPACRRIRGTWR